MKINKILIWLFFMPFIFQSLRQEFQKSLLWGEREIEWGDFQGLPEKNDFDDAHLFYSLQIDGKYIKRDSVVYSIRAIFNFSNSWTKTSSDHILKHERKHFDLAELYCRKLRKELLGKIFFEGTLAKDITNLYKSNNEELKAKQRQYDSETEHSKNFKMQSIWDKKIKDELIQLSKYSNIYVALKVNWKK